MPLRVLRVVNCAPATFQPAPAQPSRKPLPRVWPAAVAPFSPKVAIRLPDTPCSPPRPAGRKYSTALLTRSVGLAACDSGAVPKARSEEHTSELQSQSNLVCRLLLEKKKKKKKRAKCHD